MFTVFSPPMADSILRVMMCFPAVKCYFPTTKIKSIYCFSKLSIFRYFHFNNDVFYIRKPLSFESINGII